MELVTVTEIEEALTLEILALTAVALDTIEIPEMLMPIQTIKAIKDLADNFLDFIISLHTPRSEWSHQD